MKTPRPCVLLWFSRTGTFEEQDAAYDVLHAEVSPPDGRSMTMSGDDELGSVEEKIDGLPLSERYAEAAIAAARQKGLDKVTFVAAIFFRDGAEAPRTPGTFHRCALLAGLIFPFPSGVIISRATSTAG